MKKCSAYWAFPGYEKDLIDELNIDGIAFEQTDRLFLTGPSERKLMWAQMNLLDSFIFEFNSISEASQILKEHGKRWSSLHQKNFRRAELIQRSTFNYKPKNINFLEPLKNIEWSFWSLLEEKKILMCPTAHLKFPAHEFIFNEDTEIAPSRAYLKLWEAMTLYGIKPAPGQKVIDLGGCPGGWTWVLQSLGCHVISVDKAPLAPQILKLPQVQYLKQDAFKLKPQDIGPIDWFFSDIICYPEKLLELVKKWNDSGMVKNFFCSVKFKGQTDFSVLKELSLFPNSQIRHLSHNKHEVTWVSIADIEKTGPFSFY